MAWKFKARFDKQASEELQRKLKGLAAPITQAQARTLGADVVDAMRDTIAAGYSPISGPGIQQRLAAYKDPKRYPGKKKAHTPVNLYLTGKFLSDLKFRVIKVASGWGVSVGFTNRKSQLKEEGHRYGQNGQPSRPIIPIGNEKFIKRIQSLYMAVIREAIEKVSKR